MVTITRVNGKRLTVWYTLGQCHRVCSTVLSEDRSLYLLGQSRSMNGQQLTANAAETTIRVGPQLHGEQLMLARCPTKSYQVDPQLLGEQLMLARCPTKVAPVSPPANLHTGCKKAVKSVYVQDISNRGSEPKKKNNK